MSPGTSVMIIGICQRLSDKEKMQDLVKRGFFTTENFVFVDTVIFYSILRNFHFLTNAIIKMQCC